MIRSPAGCHPRVLKIIDAYERHDAARPREGGPDAERR
jgi:hypothetical protein